ncbi:MAG: twin-arginine translocase TatA/TatE family subunit [Candidatus Marinimicrobia bacterium]|nr:twin-arginine translocase TatA/TatE family subunit [Candidatus Neomarinimicrobiota bacterium]|tara:strand:- start:519 stop:743 length:225 start_codon:yes stop_codon:yes gene_type:complete
MNLLNIPFLVSIGGWEVLLIFLVVLLLFGAKKLPELAKGLGKGIREFKGAVEGIEKEFDDAVDSIDKNKDDKNI